jgi:signal transduction histidine kinase
MQAVGIYLIFAAVILRAAVVLSNEPAFPIVLALLACYGVLLFGKRLLMSRKSPRLLQSQKLQLGYIFIQSVLVGILTISTDEDFLALLFIPLSLDAVSLFGRRVGYMIIAIFSLAIFVTFLSSAEGPLFGLAMGVLYSGICFLFGGYAYQIQKAEAARKQNEQMFNELQVANRQLQGYTDQIASLAIEQERNRLARDLHDSVTQTVFSMNLAAQSAHLLLEKEPARIEGQLIHIEELAVSAQREIQSLVSQLSPYLVSEVNLPAALHKLAAEQKIKNGLQVSLEVHGERVLSKAIVAGLYSIANEALTNVVKHSGVCEAAVRLNLDKEDSCLEIEDYGIGFDPESKSEERGHLGLTGMSERASEIGWNLSVESHPGHGTHIHVWENPPRGLE